MWTADITADRSSEYKLYVELLNNNQAEARIQRRPDGNIELLFYGGGRIAIPWQWLSDIASRYEEETKNQK